MPPITKEVNVSNIDRKPPDDRYVDESKVNQDAFTRWYKNPVFRPAKKKTSYWSSGWSFNDDLWGPYDDGFGSLYTSAGLTRTNKDINKKTCEDALRAVGRSANVILNSGSDERRLSVKYSNGSSINTIKDNVIYISPDKLINAGSDKEKKNDAIDALCGQVMLSSQIKRQVAPNVYDKFMAEKDHDVCSLWSAIELAVARSSVISDWAGFKPYFDTYAMHSTDASATAIRKMLTAHDGSSEERKTSASVFIKGLAWNLYMSHSPVKIPSAYDSGKAIVAEGLSNVKTSEDRWNFCNEVVKALRLMFDDPEPEQEEPDDGVPEGHSFVDEPGVGLVDVSKEAAPSPIKVPPMKKKGADKFSGIDRELFGLDPVSNKKCAAANTIDAITGDKSSEASDVMSAPAVPDIDGECKAQGRPVWLAPDKTTPEARRKAWGDKLKTMDLCVERLRDSFNLKSLDAARKVTGYRDGVLHEGSLYKVPMGLDTVFYKKSRTETDRVSICLLIDQSGSMSTGSYHSSRQRINDAAEVAYVLAKLCKSVSKINLSIVGFTAQQGSLEAKAKGIDYNDELDLRLIYDDDDSSVSSLDTILDMRAHSNNTDGFAIWHTAKHLSSTKAAYRRKVMIVVSDGQPNANGYGGDSALTHVNLCKTDARKRFGVETYAIGVDNAYSKRVGDKMYGPGNNIIIHDVKSSLGYISRFLNQVAESTS